MFYFVKVGELVKFIYVTKISQHNFFQIQNHKSIKGEVVRQEFCQPSCHGTVSLKQTFFNFFHVIHVIHIIHVIHVMLFNDIFDKGIFPSQWKRAQVTAIIKSGDKDKTDKASYRPISILATLSKMCESIIHNWLLSHFLTNNIITPCQSAYLPGDSTAQQLINMIHKIKTAWSEKKIARAVFLDVSSAFDAVWHNALLQKLSQCGIDCKAFEVIQSYLSDRKMSLQLMEYCQMKLLFSVESHKVAVLALSFLSFT